MKIPGQGIVDSVRNAWRLRSIVATGGHLVVLGHSRLSRAMLRRRMAMASIPAIVVSTRPDDADDAFDSGAAFVCGDLLDPSVLEKAAIPRTSEIWCLAGSSDGNVAIADAVSRVLDAGRGSSAPPALHVGVDDPALRASAKAKPEAVVRPGAAYVHLFSPARITARRLFREAPSRGFRVLDEKHRTAWVIGATALGEEIVLQLIRETALQDGASLRIVVLDPAADSFGARLGNRWPGAASACDLRCVAGDDAADLVAALLGDGGRPSAIYVCGDDEIRNLGMGTRVAAALASAQQRMPPIWVRQRSTTPTGDAGTAFSGPWLRPFGADEWIADEIGMQGQLDAIARAIHEHYEASAVRAGETDARRSLGAWMLLPEDLKDDNRRVADHYFRAARALGFFIRPDQGEWIFPWTDAEVTMFARLEHDRWRADRMLEGWRSAPDRDDERKAHPDLVPYDALPVERQTLSVDIARDVPHILARAGFALLRGIEIEMRGPESPWPDNAQFDASIADILGDFLGGARAPFLWADHGSSMACRAVEIARDRFALPCGIVVRNPWPASSGDDRSDARRANLLRTAQTVVHVPMPRDGNHDFVVNQATHRFRFCTETEALAPEPDTWTIAQNGRVVFTPGSRDAFQSSQRARNPEQ